MNGIEPGPLVIATHNQGKFAEFQSILEPLGFKLTSNSDHNLSEPEETEDNFVGNALIKAKAASEALGIAALADDSGLCVDCLQGAPGVYTADWAETPEGRDFPMAMQKLWNAVQESNCEPPYRAQFRCTLVFYWPGGSYRVFEGSLDGQILWPPMGQQGHGFDPCFQPDGYDTSLGTLAPDIKNKISHRADAVRAFKTALNG